jgi:hypothetical protein
MTPRRVLNLGAAALMASAALLAVLALIHHNVVETQVFFFDNLNNEVDFQAGRDVTYLLYSLAAVALLNGIFLRLAARRIKP